MGDNPLLGSIRDELKKTEYDPIRNAKLRIVADANGAFREIVEELLYNVNYGKINAVKALIKMVEADAEIKENLRNAHEYIEVQSEIKTIEDTVEQRNKLKEKYGTSDWKSLNSMIYSNIYTMQYGSSSDSESNVENNEDEENTKSKEAASKRTVNENELNKHFAELNKLIGLSKAKETIQQYINLVKYNKVLEEKNIPTSPISYHMVFKGNPGAGKTTVANIVASIYKAMGVLSSGHLVSVARPDLVGRHIGETEKKTTEVIESALGGVLFIDEAYSLFVNDADVGGNDFGHQAITTLLDEMEKHRDDLIVIVAGYNDEMEAFIRSNPGLSSRFSTKIDFEDYSSDELYLICKNMLKNRHLIISKNADARLQGFCQELYDTKDKYFGNAREIRNFTEKLYLELSTRISKSGNIEDLDVTNLTTIHEEDIERTISKWYPAVDRSTKKEAPNNGKSIEGIYTSNP